MGGDVWVGGGNTGHGNTASTVVFSLTSHARQAGPDLPGATWEGQMVVHEFFFCIYLGGWFNKDIFTLDELVWIKAGEMESERSEFTVAKWNSNICT